MSEKSASDDSKETDEAIERGLKEEPDILRDFSRKLLTPDEVFQVHESLESLKETLQKKDMKTEEMKKFIDSINWKRWDANPNDFGFIKQEESKENKEGKKI